MILVGPLRQISGFLKLVTLFVGCAQAAVFALALTIPTRTYEYIKNFFLKLSPTNSTKPSFIHQFIHFFKKIFPSIAPLYILAGIGITMAMMGFFLMGLPGLLLGVPAVLGLYCYKRTQSLLTGHFFEQGFKDFYKIPLIYSA